MSIKGNLLLFLVVATYVILETATSHANDDQITLFLQSFEGRQNLGRNVTTVLELQIWKTFRKSSTTNPSGQSFGKCQIFRNYEPLVIKGYSDAEDIAMDAHNLAQAILWGKAWEYGDGIVAQSYLALPLYNDLRETHNEKWKIHFFAKSKEFTFEVDLPSRRYEFKPVVLDPAFVEDYSTPLALPIYATRDHKRIIGYAGREVAGHKVYEFTAIKSGYDYVQVISNGKTGWLYLPKISQQESEIVNFVGGIIRLFRGDWTGTVELMQKVVNDKRVPTHLRADAYLYMSLAKYNLGIPYDIEIENAIALNPYSKSAARYQIMQAIDNLKKAFSKNDANNIRQYIANIESIIQHSRYLFSESDVWIEDLMDKLRYLSSSN